MPSPTTTTTGADDVLPSTSCLKLNIPKNIVKQRSVSYMEGGGGNSRFGEIGGPQVIENGLGKHEIYQGPLHAALGKTLTNPGSQKYRRSLDLSNASMRKLNSGPPTDESDSSVSDAVPTISVSLDPEQDGGEDLNMEIPVCPDSHKTGKEIVNSIIPANVDTVFAMLFTDSKFFTEMHTGRKTFNIVHSEWKPNSDGSQVRQVSFTVTLTGAIGPPHSHVTESQLMLAASKRGRMYAVDVESVNAGIPYADAFYVTVHFCMSRISQNETKLSIIAQVKYRKSINFVIKGFIEKNAWAGIQEFYTYLDRALQEECKKIENGQSQSPIISPETTSKEAPIATKTWRGRTKKRIAPNPPGVPSASVRNGNIETADVPTTSAGSTRGIGETGSGDRSVVLKVIVGMLFGLLLLNAFLFVKLTRFETGKLHLLSASQSTFSKNASFDNQEWTALLQQQEDMHRLELQKWHGILNSALKILHEAEEDLKSLKLQITSYDNNKFTVDALKEAIHVETETSTGTGSKTFTEETTSEVNLENVSTNKDTKNSKQQSGHIENANESTSHNRSNNSDL